MHVSLFDFALPEERIATHPASPRDGARLLHVTRESLTDRTIRDLPELLAPGDVLVLNNTKVIPARLYGTRGEVKVEILLHQRQETGVWSAFARPGKRLKPGDDIIFAPGFSAHVEQKCKDGQVILRFNATEKALPALLETHGQMPLPPYITRPEGATPEDIADYQTCYAEHEGSVAAPTAGLHFTPALLEALEARGVRLAYVTLHVGGGTFLPVKVENTKDHIMHSEWGEVTEETAKTINQVKTEGGNIIAVGTTALRLLETSADVSGHLHAWAGSTDIFITPGYRFKAVDRLLTNFHLPRSTLFMLVGAFAGLARMHSAYTHAIAEQYRFYSYGDACLLERTESISPSL